MSVPPRRLPERPSLEQLRKQAREHLNTLRAGDPSVKLAAAQHALAREYGFDSWPKLVHHVETVHPANRMRQPAELKSDQKLLWSQGRGTDVWALIQACASGDLEAVRALIAKDRSLARSHYDYRKPLYFAVREIASTSFASCSSTIATRWISGWTMIRSRLHAIAATRRWSSC